MRKTAEKKTDTSKTETCVGFAVLMVLAAVAVGVYWKQAHYDPSVFKASVAKEEPAGYSVPAVEAPNLQTYLPADIKLLAPSEVFGPDNLSDKIDGKAEFYLSTGFVSLRSQRFAAAANPQSWMEVYIYDMGDTRNAFAVYSTQKRPDSEKLDFASFGYKTDNALYFVHGKEYVEIIASDASAELRKAMLAFARKFLSVQPGSAATAELNETAMFPKENLKEGSIALLASDVFGFSRLNNIYKANYSSGKAQVTLFLSLRQTSQEASDLSDAYHRFLIENGGSDVRLSVSIPGAALVQVFDTFELIFSKGRLLAGVHEADQKAAAEETGLMLYRKISEVPD